MKRKALLLIIPFAAAALTGCKQNVKPCSDANITFQSTINVDVDEKTKIPYTIEGGTCSGDLNFTFSKQGIVEITFENGAYYVKGLAEGEVDVTCNGKTTFTVVVGGETPEPGKEVVEVLSVKSAPATIGVNEELDPSMVVLNVKLSDETQSTAKATKIELVTSKAGETEGTAWYRTVGSATFNIQVIDEPPVEELEPADVIELCDNAGEGNVVDHEVVVVGVATNSSVKTDYGIQWSGEFDGSSLTFDSAGTTETYDTLNGKIIKVKGYPELYNGKYKIGYLPANISPTGSKYNPTLLDVIDPAPQKEVTGITAATYSKTLYVGGTIAASDVTLTVTYSDGTSGTVKAQSVDGYSTASAGNTTATAHYGTFTKDFVVEVKDAPVAEELSPAQVIALCDEAGSGVVVDHEVIVVGVAKDTSVKTDYGIQWSGKFEGSNLTFDSAGTTETYDTLNGKTIKVKGYPELYNGTYKIGYLPANISPTGSKYNPTLLSVSDPVQKEVKSIEISGTPAKTSYYVGESYSAAGLSVVATYTDDTTSTVSATISPDKEKAALGDTSVTFSATFGGKTATMDVTVSVSEKPAPASVNVEYDFKDLTKNDGTALDATTALAAFTNGKTLGDHIVTAVAPTKAYAGDKTLRVGSSNATSGQGALELTLSKNVTQVVITARGYSATDLNDISIGSQVETVTAESAEYVYLVSSTKSVKIDTSKRVLIEKIGFVAEGVQPEKQITGIELQGTLAKSSYVEGQTFDPSGLSLKVTYDDLSEETVTSGFTFDVANPLAVGEYDLKAIYQQHESSNSVHISVVAKALTALEIKSGMTKTAYTPDDCWESNGIVVEGTYNDGSKATLAEASYSLDFDPADPYLDCEEVSIVARASGGIASAAFVQAVTVTEEPIEATLTGIAASGYTNTATVGQTYTFDGTVTASYSDGSSHAVTGYTWTTPISTASAGEKTGVISYTEDGVTKTCNVVVTVSAPAPVESSMKEGYEAAAKLSSGSATPSAYTFSGVVTGKRTNSSSSVEYMVQDGDYAIDVFNPSNKTPFVVGNTVTITSTLQNYNGLIETKSISSVTAGGTAAAATPVDIKSLADINALKTSVLVKGAGTVVTKPTYNATSDLTLKIKVGNDQISVFFKKNFIAAFKTFIESLNADDAITINNAVVGCYSGTNQFTVIDETVLSKGPAKEIASLGQVTAPASIGKGGTLNVSDVSVAVTYDDTTTGSVHPDRIELDTSTVAESVTGTVYVGDLSTTFTIKVEEAAQTKDYEFAYESKTNPTGLTSSVAAGGFETGGRLAQWTSCGGFTISTSSSYSNVTKVIVNTSTNGADNVYEISCTVGGNEFGSTVSMLKKSANEDIVFEDDAADGVVVITYTFTSGTKKSIYVGKITITAK